MHRPATRNLLAKFGEDNVHYTYHRSRSPDVNVPKARSVPPKDVPNVNRPSKSVKLPRLHPTWPGELSKTLLPSFSGTNIARI